MTVLYAVLKAGAVYFGLLAAMKILGKRQTGELQISELITTLLISELATVPIIDDRISPLIPVAALGAILLLEIATSFLALKIPFVREFLEGKPSALIHNGKPDKKELRRARISMDELLSEIRLQGISEPEQVLNATLESNGKLSIILKSKYRPLSFDDLNIECAEEGVAHAVVTAGRVDSNELKACGKDERWLDKLLKKKNAQIKDVLLLTVTDGGRVFLVLEDE